MFIWIYEYVFSNYQYFISLGCTNITLENLKSIFYSNDTIWKYQKEETLKRARNFLKIINEPIIISKTDYQVIILE